MSTSDLLGLIALVVFLVLFCRWILHVGRETPKPKRVPQPMTDYERGYRAAWRRAVWFWW